MPQGAGGPRWGSCPSVCPCYAPVHGGPSWFLSGAWCVSRGALGLALAEQRGVWVPHGQLPGMCCSPAARPPGPLPQLWEAQAPGRPGPPGAHPAAGVPGSRSLLSPQYVCMTASPRKASTTWSSTCKCLVGPGASTLSQPLGDSPLTLGQLAQLPAQPHPLCFLCGSTDRTGPSAPPEHAGGRGERKGRTQEQVTGLPPSLPLGVLITAGLGRHRLARTCACL